MLLSADSQAAGLRLDQWLHQQLSEYSRSRIQEWIKAERVHVNGAAVRASYTLRAGDTVDVEPAAAPPLHAAPEAIPLVVLYELSILLSAVLGRPSPEVADQLASAEGS